MDCASKTSVAARAKRVARDRDVVLRRAAWGPAHVAQESLESRVLLAADVVISEIMYHPESGDARDEYVEIHNRGTSAAVLEGWRFTKGIDYTFHDYTLGAGAYVVVAADLTRFHTNYPGVVNVIGGQWDGRLSNSGETLELEDGDGDTADEVTYADEGDWAVRSRPVERWKTPMAVTHSGSTVWVALPFHMYQVGDSVEITGADQDEYNGTFVVTGVTEVAFSFTMWDTPDSPATGEVRVRRTLDHGHAGWDWHQRADGWGGSLELINPGLANDYAHNWSSSTGAGTPGAANSVASGNIAPMVVDARHFPIVPKPTEGVMITARLVDESIGGLSATLHWRRDGEPSFDAITMADDGQHGDGLAGDGVWGASVPAQADGTVVEFYVTAQDAAGNTRIWPAPAQERDGAPAADGAYPMYQVDATPYSGLQPLFKLIMSEAERAELADIGSLPSDGSFEDESTASMNGTFISIEPNGAEVRYLVGIRNRGTSSRQVQPNNYRVSFPTDRTWKDLTDINLNARYSMEEIAGSALFRQSGLTAQDALPVHVRVNNVDPAVSAFDMFGSYAWVEAENDAFVSNHFPTDDGGNYYRGVRRYTTNQPLANLAYRGDDANFYRLDYAKQTNSEQDDYADIIALVRAFDPDQTSGDDAFAAAVAEHIDVAQWLRYFAATTLIGDSETTLGSGVGDDYSLYRGDDDPRFRLIVHDLDTILGRGDATADPTRSIFQAATVPAINRLLRSPTFAPLYYAQLVDLLNTTFDPTNLGVTLTNVLGSYVPSDVIASMRQFAAQRKAYVLSQIPRALTATAPGLPMQNGYLRTTDAAVDLAGMADVIGTRSVVVNGQLASWVAWQGTWATEGVALQPGVNRIVVQAMDDGAEIARTTVDVWRDVAPGDTVGGTLAAGNHFWTAAAGPYHVTSDLTVPAGATLFIEPGTSVYFDPGVSVSVLGRVVAEGTSTERIRFTRTPGSTGSWDGFIFDYPTTLPTALRPDNRIAYADFDFSDGGSEAIYTDKANLYLDNIIWSNHTKQYIDLNDSSFVLRNSYLPGISTAELVHFWGFPSDGYTLVEGNTFGHTSGYNDIIDFTGGQRPGPIARFLNNTFLGGSDDGLDLDAADAHVEGNVFMNFHQDAARDSKSHAVSTGTEGGVLSEITVVRNFFYDVDHAILIKNSAYGTIVNNTIVKVHKIHQEATTAAINLYEPRSGQWPGAGVYLEGNIFQDVSAMFENPVTPGYDVEITINNSIYPLIPGEPVWPGTGNFHGEANLLNTTNVTDPRKDFQLRAGAGPARGTGYNGVDRGAAIPPGASISGEPLGTTDSTSATLTVGGPDIHAYRYRVNGGPWSTEVPITNPGLPDQVIPPIQLDGLVNGTYTVHVIAKNSAGFWQAAHEATDSRTWTVNAATPPPIQISEVIARNTAISHGGRARLDMIELHNPGGSPVSLLGMSITDNTNSPRKHVFGNVTIQPGEYLVLYADDPDGSPGGVFTGFALRAQGEGVHLYNAPANGGALIDSVVFGSQLENLSIGRVDGAWQLTVPTFGTANVAQPAGDPARLRINEWLADGQDPFNHDFIEVWNSDPLPVDMGGLWITDAPDGWPNQHVITPLTFVGGGGHYVFTADSEPGQGAHHASFRLAAEQGLIAIFDGDGKQIDRVLYGTQRPGVSQGRSPDGDARFAFFTQPSPGASNPGTGQQPTTVTLDLLSFDADWRYFEPGAPADQGFITWKDPGYSDAVWPQGAGLLYVDGSSLPEPKRTPLTLGRTTYYFRANFHLAVDPMTLTGLRLRTVLDDGAVIYINGHEVKRVRMPDAPAVITDSTLAEEDVGNATTETILLDDAVQYLVEGVNVIAVEVHQHNSDSSDIVWGGELQATQTLENEQPSPLTLRVTEINYNPPDGGASGGGASEDYEFIEVMNVGASRINLNGVRFTAGIEFTFDSFGLEPGARAVIVRNRDAFTGRYGPGVLIAGEYGGTLDDAGSQVRLVDINGLLVQDFAYSDLWHPESDGGGHTLAIVDPGADPATWSDPASWRSSTFLFGTPFGTPYADDANVPVLPGAIVISELVSRGTGPDGDWIELHNVAGGPVHIGGWTLSNASGNVLKYVIPIGTTIPANGRLVLTEKVHFGATGAPGAYVPFSLGDVGGEVYLSSSESLGIRLTGYRERAAYGASDPDTAFVRHTNSVGRTEHVAAVTPTPGAADAEPAVGPVVISEIMYHPAGAGLEFVELRNFSDAPVSLAGWRFTDGIVFEFPAGAVIPAGGVVVIASVDPAMFRAAYGLSDSVVVFGPYIGALDNAGERLALARPGVAVNGTVPYVLVDHLRYSPTTPWPTSADGQGPSITRIAPPSYGDEPQAWEGGPNGGTPGDGVVVSPILIDGTNGADVFELALNAAGTHIDIRRGGATVLSLPVGPSAPLVINGLDGDDRIVLDFANGSPTPGGGVTFAGGAGADTLAVTGTAAGAGLSFDEASAMIGASAFVHAGIERIELGMPQAASLSLGGAVKAAVTAPGGVFSTDGIAMGPGARLDLGGGDLLVKGGDLAAITALVRSARNGGEPRWSGSGIGTSAATSHTGLAAVAQGSDILVKHTYNGDANADGRINADDYFRIDSGFLAQPLDATYARGDFNYDARINADDYFLIDSAFLGQGAPVSATAAPSAGAAPAMATSVVASDTTPTESKTSTRSIPLRVFDTITQTIRRRKSPRGR